MKHCIVRSGRCFLTPRRATGSLYQNRSTMSPSSDEARVFNTQAAAVNSAKQAGLTDFEVIEVLLDWNRSVEYTNGKKTT